MKFGQKQSVDDKMKVAKSRVGKVATPAKKTKNKKVRVKPILGKKKVGIRVKVDF